MIPEFGLFSLILGLLMAIALAILPPIGLYQPKVNYLSRTLVSAAIAQCFFVMLSFLTLVFCFVQNDFTVQYVASNSNTNLPLIYRFCAVWGAHEGSLLLWSVILSVWTVFVALATKKLPLPMRIMLLAVLAAIQVGFLLLILQTSNPFLRFLPLSPEQGADLNPLLQDPGFVLHPPFLYLGYVGLAVPFAFAISAMLTKDKYSQWIIWARPWALLAWSFLTIGIALGSWWAYYELGWGGWWFWDPVENASFMPWLMGAALTHSLMVAAKSPYFTRWSILLALCAFILSLIGTFLVRSGVLSSVHSFASDPLRGTYILAFLALVIGSAFALFFSRATEKSDFIQPPVVSKTSFILLGNMLLFVATLTVLLGTLYPLLIEVLQDKQLSVGPPYFNQVFVPLVLPVIILMAIVPNFSWQKITKINWRAKCIGYAASLIPITILLLLFPSYYSWPMRIGCLLGAILILATIIHKFWQYKAQSWGMVFAHVGVGLSVLGMSLVSALETEKEFTIGLQQTKVVQGHAITFAGLDDVAGSNYEGVRAHFRVKNQHKTINMYPEKRFFIPREAPMTETAIDAGLSRDLYMALGEKMPDQTWSVRFYIKPFIRWIWAGAILVAIGAFLSAMVAFKEIKLIEDKA